MNNWLKTTVLFAAIMALFVLIGGLIGGRSGMLMALLLGGGMNIVAYWFSDRMVLSMYNAQPVDDTSSPYLYRIVHELAQRAGLPMPRVYLINEAQPNAFATGRNPENAAVAATTGIVNLLSEGELRGVMAHELAHIKHRDILTSTIAATLAGAISALANFALFFGGRDESGRPANAVVGLIVALIAPLAAMLIQMAISRAREFEADRGGAEICQDPLALAGALAKMETYAQGTPFPTAEAHPATAQMMIVNPLAGGAVDSLFSTHPKTAERIARLEAMGRPGR